MKQPEEKLKFAPPEVFNQILEYAVIPTFDLVIEIPQRGVVLVRRRIAPYADQWALPGLRMYKSESIEEALQRIAKSEVGLSIDPKKRVFLGQFVGRFKTEHKRQDISTGYAVRGTSNSIVLNAKHFSSLRFIRGLEEVPTRTGAMYKFYLREYFKLR